MHWEKMTVNEYAAYQKGSGATIIRVDNIWWRAVRPFFYRPLFPFHKVSDHSIRPPASSIMCGYQYPVADEKRANSYLNFIIFDDIHSYSIESLKHKQRNEIKRAMKSLTIEKVDHPDAFVKGAYEPYIDFYKRTRYKWKSDRLGYRSFVEWSQHLFENRKILVHGVLAKNQGIVAVNVSYLIEDIIMDATFFSTTAALKMGSSELVWHTIRKCAAETKEARYICEGAVTGNKGVDEAKIRRGCSVLVQPAYFHVNRAFHLLLRSVGGKAYSKVLGMNNEQVASALLK